MKKNIFFLFIAAAVISYAQDVPADYPADLPRPISSKFFASASDFGGITFTFKSTESPITIFDAFKADMEKNKFTMNSQGDNVISDIGGIVKWTKDGKTALVLFSLNDDKKNTSIVINYK